MREQEKTDDDGNEEEAEKPTELTSKLLNEIIQNFQYAYDFAKEKDPIEVRKSSKMFLMTSKVAVRKLRKKKKEGSRMSLGNHH